MPDYTEGENQFMIPLLDMLNHNREAACKIHYVYTEKKYQIIATKPAREGEQIFISYGERSNLELLTAYGFMEEANPLDEFRLGSNETLKVSSEETEPALVSKPLHLKEVRSSESGHQTYILLDKAPTIPIENQLELLEGLIRQSEVRLREMDEEARHKQQDERLPAELCCHVRWVRATRRACLARVQGQLQEAVTLLPKVTSTSTSTVVL